jgi:hypothetical protein
VPIVLITSHGKQAAQRAIDPAPPASKLSAQQIPQMFLAFDLKFPTLFMFKFFLTSFNSKFPERNPSPKLRALKNSPPLLDTLSTPVTFLSLFAFKCHFCHFDHQR